MITIYVSTDNKWFRTIYENIHTVLIVQIHLVIWSHPTEPFLSCCDQSSKNGNKKYQSTVSPYVMIYIQSNFKEQMQNQTLMCKHDGYVPKGVKNFCSGKLRIQDNLWSSRINGSI